MRRRIAVIDEDEIGLVGALGEPDTQIGRGRGRIDPHRVVGAHVSVRDPIGRIADRQTNRRRHTDRKAKGLRGRRNRDGKQQQNQYFTVTQHGTPQSGSTRRRWGEVYRNVVTNR